MQSKQPIQDVAKVIVSFSDSYAQNKQRKQNEQYESESTTSLTKVTSRLEYLWRQIENKKSCKQVIRIPKLLQSLISLVTFRLGTHLREEKDRQRLEVRHHSRQCLRQIRMYGDAQNFADLVNVGYGRVISIAFCTAGGVGEEQDAQIWNVLNSIYNFLRQLHEGKTNDQQPSFQPLPLLARRTEEQIEEEGANEELEAQIKNNENNGYIKSWAKFAKTATLNCFIRRR
ncbi:MAG: hypothetical protein EZS28_019345 [Streblomastix strix]|uniref:Uncharacterized protein n=1 Tax=Streblomastix strix TaxID=222440 RepID=A0A5J4VRV9_9EUKA|nr:MAG: hypothetical protein EZS28_019345 [Streblomastix strix]